MSFTDRVFLSSLLFSYSTRFTDGFLFLPSYSHCGTRDKIEYGNKKTKSTGTSAFAEG